MQNKIVLSAVLLACLWALSGCSGFSSSTAVLMRPPRLTPEQSAINEAFTAAALTQTYTLKYPKSCLLYTSDAADEQRGVTHGWRPSIEKQ